MSLRPDEKASRTGFWLPNFSWPVGNYKDEVWSNDRRAEWHHKIFVFSSFVDPPSQQLTTLKKCFKVLFLRFSFILYNFFKFDLFQFCVFQMVMLQWNSLHKCRWFLANMNSKNLTEIMNVLLGGQRTSLFEVDIVNKPRRPICFSSLNGHRPNQARNQLGPQRGEEFSESGQNFLNYVHYFQTTPNTFFQGGEIFSRGGFSPHTRPWLRAWSQHTLIIWFSF